MFETAYQLITSHFLL